MYQKPTIGSPCVSHHLQPCPSIEDPEGYDVIQLPDGQLTKAAGFCTNLRSENGG